MPALKALIAQLGSLALLFVIGHGSGLPFSPPLALALLQGAIAAFFSSGLRAARWWTIIHLLFLPCVVLATESGLPAWIYLAGFALLAMVYWSSFRTQVPLFLSNKLTVHRLAAWLPGSTGAHATRYRQRHRIVGAAPGAGCAPTGRFTASKRPRAVLAVAPHVPQTSPTHI